jgi:AcrR family transcriptional regulator
VGRPPTEARERILEAAIAIVARDGPERLTLEAVAKATKLSKAGVLYYFHGKDALLLGVMEALVASWEGCVRASMAKDPVTVGRFARSLICTEPPTEEYGRAYRAMIAMGNRYPALAEPQRRLYTSFHQLLEDDGLDPVDAALVMAAADGLWFYRLLGFTPLPAHLENGVVERLRAIASKTAKTSKPTRAKTARSRSRPK